MVHITLEKVLCLINCEYILLMMTTFFVDIKYIFVDAEYIFVDVEYIFGDVECNIFC